ncbi:tol-pal system protein YbgF [Nereida sp. MMG025]|uniref:tol-pal system protein YbgF n=1 Tax=Nereida sp. MMG025 TaxID=2909981 RepID=UPI001F01D61C|nr:tol-pal system protein YbgF [Nereida sp. MMG025]MCF6444983.1 tol-pal system protein YbgF [Nereida sp. MMG025]
MALRRFGIAIALVLTPFGASAETLADVRNDLGALRAEIASLKAELTATGSTDPLAGDAPTLDRIQTMEQSLTRLTAKTEDLEIRLGRVVSDGTNRIGDLEFRICDLDPACDIGSIGETAPLGGETSAAPAPIAQPTPSQAPSLAIGEQADFQRASEALASGDFRAAADQFATFSQTYPGGPLAAQANLLRGDALAGLGDMAPAARAYLEAFSANPEGPDAPQSLFKLGKALADLGQTSEACVTLGEVANRFPTAEQALEAQSARRNLGCS